MNSKKGCQRPKKLITRSIMPETSPDSPHITLTHPKSRFVHFWDQPQPPSWSKLAICAKSGLVFLSGQDSNPKVHGYREKFNIGNVAQIFFCGLLYMLGVSHVIFGKNFNVKVFTVTVNVTVTLVQAIFQEMRNLRIFILF